MEEETVSWTDGWLVVIGVLATWTFVLVEALVAEGFTRDEGVIIATQWFLQISGVKK